MQSVTQNGLCLPQHSYHGLSHSHRGSLLCLKNANFEIKGSGSYLHDYAKRPCSGCKRHCADLLVSSTGDFHSIILLRLPTVYDPSSGSNEAEPCGPFPLCWMAPAHCLWVFYELFELVFPGTTIGIALNT